MGNVIIIGIILILVLNGIHSSIMHFKGEGGCCGDVTSAKVKKKKIKSVVATKVVSIEGMTCEHCKNRVENSLNAIDGVAARVNLKKKIAVVSMESLISESEIKKAIENVGYKVISIR
ncbi:MAG: heavy-metal-associated domain-containing protein [Wujia sp.]